MKGWGDEYKSLYPALRNGEVGEVRSAPHEGEMACVGRLCGDAFAEQLNRL